MACLLAEVYEDVYLQMFGEIREERYEFTEWL
jgi:hypothetical protein